MKTQGNIIPPKVNISTIMESNDSEVDEISDNKFKRITIRMMDEIKKA
jgi:hypothetical protein